MQNYKTRHETVSINQINYNIRSLKDKQQFSDDNKKAEALGISSATWPLFGVLWPSSRVLAATVCLFELEDKRVLEIGCGLGLSSIVLHKMGVDITASDYHPLASEFLQKNVYINHLDPIKYLEGNWETENLLLGKFDLIIGSDVLYEPEHVNNVSQFINSHSSLSVDVIIVDPNRGNRSKFTQAMKALGYSHYYEKFDIADTASTRCSGRVLHFKRRV